MLNNDGLLSVQNSSQHVKLSHTHTPKSAKQFERKDKREIFGFYFSFLLIVFKFLTVQS